MWRNAPAIAAIFLFCWPPKHWLAISTATVVPTNVWHQQNDAANGGAIWSDFRNEPPLVQIPNVNAQMPPSLQQQANNYDQPPPRKPQQVDLGLVETQDAQRAFNQQFPTTQNRGPNDRSASVGNGIYSTLPVYAPPHEETIQRDSVVMVPRQIPSIQSPLWNNVVYPQGSLPLLSIKNIPSPTISSRTYESTHPTAYGQASPSNAEASSFILPRNSVRDLQFPAPYSNNKPDFHYRSSIYGQVPERGNIGPLSNIGIFTTFDSGESAYFPGPDLLQSQKLFYSGREQEPSAIKQPLINTPIINTFPQNPINNLQTEPRPQSDGTNHGVHSSGIQPPELLGGIGNFIHTDIPQPKLPPQFPFNFHQNQNNYNRPEKLDEQNLKTNDQMANGPGYIMSNSNVQSPLYPMAVPSVLPVMKEGILEPLPNQGNRLTYPTASHTPNTLINPGDFVPLNAKQNRPLVSPPINSLHLENGALGGGMMDQEHYENRLQDIIHNKQVWQNHESPKSQEQHFDAHQPNIFYSNQAPMKSTVFPGMQTATSVDMTHQPQPLANKIDASTGFFQMSNKLPINEDLRTHSLHQMPTSGQSYENSVLTDGPISKHNQVINPADFEPFSISTRTKHMYDPVGVSQMVRPVVNAGEPQNVIPRGSPPTDRINESGVPIEQRTSPGIINSESHRDDVKIENSGPTLENSTGGSKKEPVFQRLPIFSVVGDTPMGFPQTPQEWTARYKIPYAPKISNLPYSSDFQFLTPQHHLLPLPITVQRDSAKRIFDQGGHPYIPFDEDSMSPGAFLNSMEVPTSRATVSQNPPQEEINQTPDGQQYPQPVVDWPSNNRPADTGSGRNTNRYDTKSGTFSDFHNYFMRGNSNKQSTDDNFESKVNTVQLLYPGTNRGTTYSMSNSEAIGEDLRKQMSESSRPEWVLDGKRENLYSKIRDQPDHMDYSHSGQNGREVIGENIKSPSRYALEDTYENLDDVESSQTSAAKTLSDIRGTGNDKQKTIPMSVKFDTTEVKDEPNIWFPTRLSQYSMNTQMPGVPEPKKEYTSPEIIPMYNQQGNLDSNKGTQIKFNKTRQHYELTNDTEITPTSTGDSNYKAPYYLQSQYYSAEKHRSSLSSENTTGSRYFDNQNAERSSDTISDGVYRTPNSYQEEATMYGEGIPSEKIDEKFIEEQMKEETNSKLNKAIIMEDSTYQNIESGQTFSQLSPSQSSKQQLSNLDRSVTSPFADDHHQAKLSVQTKLGNQHKTSSKLNTQTNYTENNSFSKDGINVIASGQSIIDMRPKDRTYKNDMYKDNTQGLIDKQRESNKLLSEQQHLTIQDFERVSSVGSPQAQGNTDELVKLPHQPVSNDTPRPSSFIGPYDLINPLDKFSYYDGRNIPTENPLDLQDRRSLPNGNVAPTTLNPLMKETSGKYSAEDSYTGPIQQQSNSPYSEQPKYLQSFTTSQGARNVSLSQTHFREDEVNDTRNNLEPQQTFRTKLKTDAFYSSTTEMLEKPHDTKQSRPILSINSDGSKTSLQPTHYEKDGENLNETFTDTEHPASKMSEKSHLKESKIIQDLDRSDKTLYYESSLSKPSYNQKSYLTLPFPSDDGKYIVPNGNEVNPQRIFGMYNEDQRHQSKSTTKIRMRTDIHSDYVQENKSGNRSMLTGKSPTNEYGEANVKDNTKEPSLRQTYNTKPPTPASLTGSGGADHQPQTWIDGFATDETVYNGQYNKQLKVITKDVGQARQTQLQKETVADSSTDTYQSQSMRDELYPINISEAVNLDQQRNSMNPSSKLTRGKTPQVPFSLSDSEQAYWIPSSDNDENTNRYTITVQYPEYTDIPVEYEHERLGGNRNMLSTVHDGEDGVYEKDHTQEHRHSELFLRQPYNTKQSTLAHATGSDGMLFSPQTVNNEFEDGMETTTIHGQYKAAVELMSKAQNREKSILSEKQSIHTYQISNMDNVENTKQGIINEVKDNQRSTSNFENKVHYSEKENPNEKPYASTTVSDDMYNTENNQQRIAVNQPSDFLNLNTTYPLSGNSDVDRAPHPDNNKNTKQYTVTMYEEHHRFPSQTTTGLLHPETTQLPVEYDHGRLTGNRNIPPNLEDETDKRIHKEPSLNRHNDAKSSRPYSVAVTDRVDPFLQTVNNEFEERVGTNTFHSQYKVAVKFPREEPNREGSKLTRKQVDQQTIEQNYQPTMEKPQTNENSQPIRLNPTDQKHGTMQPPSKTQSQTINNEYSNTDGTKLYTTTVYDGFQRHPSTLAMNLENTELPVNKAPSKSSRLPTTDQSRQKEQFDLPSNSSSVPDSDRMYIKYQTMDKEFEGDGETKYDGEYKPTSKFVTSFPNVEYGSDPSKQKETGLKQPYNEKQSSIFSSEEGYIFPKTDNNEFEEAVGATFHGHGQYKVAVKFISEDTNRKGSKLSQTKENNRGNVDDKHESSRSAIRKDLDSNGRMRIQDPTDRHPNSIKTTPSYVNTLNEDATNQYKMNVYDEDQRRSSTLPAETNRMVSSSYGTLKTESSIDILERNDEVLGNLSPKSHPYSGQRALDEETVAGTYLPINSPTQEKNKLKLPSVAKLSSDEPPNSRIAPNVGLETQPGETNPSFSTLQQTEANGMNGDSHTVQSMIQIVTEQSNIITPFSKLSNPKNEYSTQLPKTDRTNLISHTNNDDATKPFKITVYDEDQRRSSKSTTAAKYQENVESPVDHDYGRLIEDRNKPPYTRTPESLRTNEYSETYSEDNTDQSGLKEPLLEQFYNTEPPKPSSTVRYQDNTEFDYGGLSGNREVPPNIPTNAYKDRTVIYDTDQIRQQDPSLKQQVLQGSDDSTYSIHHSDDHGTTKQYTITVYDHDRGRPSKSRTKVQYLAETDIPVEYGSLTGNKNMPPKISGISQNNKYDEANVKLDAEQSGHNEPSKQLHIAKPHSILISEGVNFKPQMVFKGDGATTSKAITQARYGTSKPASLAGLKEQTTYDEYKLLSKTSDGLHPIEDSNRTNLDLTDQQPHTFTPSLKLANQESIYETSPLPEFDPTNRVPQINNDDATAQYITILDDAARHLENTEMPVEYEHEKLSKGRDKIPITLGKLSTTESDFNEKYDADQAIQKEPFLRKPDKPSATSSAPISGRIYSQLQNVDNKLVEKLPSKFVSTVPNTSNSPVDQKVDDTKTTNDRYKLYIMSGILSHTADRNQYLTDQERYTTSPSSKLFNINHLYPSSPGFDGTYLSDDTNSESPRKQDTTNEFVDVPMSVVDPKRPSSKLTKLLPETILSSQGTSDSNMLSINNNYFEQQEKGRATTLVQFETNMPEDDSEATVATNQTTPLNEQYRQPTATKIKTSDSIEDRQSSKLRSSQYLNVPVSKQSQDAINEQTTDIKSETTMGSTTNPIYRPSKILPNTSEPTFQSSGQRLVESGLDSTSEGMVEEQANSFIETTSENRLIYGYHASKKPFSSQSLTHGVLTNFEDRSKTNTMTPQSASLNTRIPGYEAISNDDKIKYLNYAQERPGSVQVKATYDAPDDEIVLYHQLSSLKGATSSTYELQTTEGGYIRPNNDSYDTTQRNQVTDMKYDDSNKPSSHPYGKAPNKVLPTSNTLKSTTIKTDFDGALTELFSTHVPTTFSESFIRSGIRERDDTKQLSKTRGHISSSDGKILTSEGRILTHIENSPEEYTSLSGSRTISADEGKNRMPIRGEYTRLQGNFADENKLNYRGIFKDITHGQPSQGSIMDDHKTEPQSLPDFIRKHPNEMTSSTSTDSTNKYPEPTKIFTAQPDRLVSSSGSDLKPTDLYNKGISTISKPHLSTNQRISDKDYDSEVKEKSYHGTKSSYLASRKIADSTSDYITVEPTQNIENTESTLQVGGERLQGSNASETDVYANRDTDLVANQEWLKNNRKTSAEDNNGLTSDSSNLDLEKIKILMTDKLQNSSKLLNSYSDQQFQNSGKNNERLLISRRRKPENTEDQGVDEVSSETGESVVYNVSDSQTYTHRIQKPISSQASLSQNVSSRSNSEVFSQDHTMVSQEVSSTTSFDLWMNGIAINKANQTSQMIESSANLISRLKGSRLDSSPAHSDHLLSLGNSASPHDQDYETLEPQPVTSSSNTADRNILLKLSTDLKVDGLVNTVSEENHLSSSYLLSSESITTERPTNFSLVSHGQNETYRTAMDPSVKIHEKQMTNNTYTDGEKTVSNASVKSPVTSSPLLDMLGPSRLRVQTLNNDSELEDSLPMDATKVYEFNNSRPIHLENIDAAKEQQFNYGVVTGMIDVNHAEVTDQTSSTVRGINMTQSGWNKVKDSTSITDAGRQSLAQKNQDKLLESSTTSLNAPKSHQGINNRIANYKLENISGLKSSDQEGTDSTKRSDDRERYVGSLDKDSDQETLEENMQSSAINITMTQTGWKLRQNSLQPLSVDTHTEHLTRSEEPHVPPLVPLSRVGNTPNTSEPKYQNVSALSPSNYLGISGEAGTRSGETNSTETSSSDTSQLESSIILMEQNGPSKLGHQNLKTQLYSGQRTLSEEADDETNLSIQNKRKLKLSLILPVKPSNGSIVINGELETPAGDANPKLSISSSILQPESSIDLLEQNDKVQGQLISKTQAYSGQRTLGQKVTELFDQTESGVARKQWPPETGTDPTVVVKIVQRPVEGINSVPAPNLSITRAESSTDNLEPNDKVLGQLNLKTQAYSGHPTLGEDTDEENNSSIQNKSRLKLPLIIPVKRPNSSIVINGELETQAVDASPYISSSPKILLPKSTVDLSEQNDKALSPDNSKAQAYSGQRNSDQKVTVELDHTGNGVGHKQCPPETGADPTVVVNILQMPVEALNSVSVSSSVSSNTRPGSPINNWEQNNKVPSDLSLETVLYSGKRTSEDEADEDTNLPMKSSSQSKDWSKLPSVTSGEPQNKRVVPNTEPESGSGGSNPKVFSYSSTLKPDSSIDILERNDKVPSDPFSNTHTKSGGTLAKETREGNYILSKSPGRNADKSEILSLTLSEQTNNSNVPNSESDSRLGETTPKLSSSSSTSQPEIYIDLAETGKGTNLPTKPPSQIEDELKPPNNSVVPKSESGSHPGETNPRKSISSSSLLSESSINILERNHEFVNDPSSNSHAHSRQQTLGEETGDGINLPTETPSQNKYKLKLSSVTSSESSTSSIVPNSESESSPGESNPKVSSTTSILKPESSIDILELSDKVLKDLSSKTLAYSGQRTVGEETGDESKLQSATPGKPSTSSIVPDGTISTGETIPKVSSSTNGLQPDSSIDMVNTAKGTNPPTKSPSQTEDKSVLTSVISSKTASISILPNGENILSDPFSKIHTYSGQRILGEETPNGTNQSIKSPSQNKDKSELPSVTTGEPPNNSVLSNSQSSSGETNKKVSSSSSTLKHDESIDIVEQNKKVLGGPSSKTYSYSDQHTLGKNTGEAFNLPIKLPSQNMNKLNPSTIKLDDLDADELEYQNALRTLSNINSGNFKLFTAEYFIQLIQRCNCASLKFLVPILQRPNSGILVTS